MSTKVTLNLTGKDFLIACRLFDIDPKEVVESMTGNMSLACYWSVQPDSDQGGLIRLATDYFLEYAKKMQPKTLSAQIIQQLSDKYTALLTELPCRFPDPNAREQSARVLVYRWLEEICEAKKKLL